MMMYEVITVSVEMTMTVAADQGRTACNQATYKSGKSWQGMHWIRDTKRLALYMRDGYKCVWCQTDLSNAGPRSLALDHLVPRVAGGSNHHANLVTACSDCNTSRGAKDWMAFAGDETVVQRVLDTVALPLDVKAVKNALLVN